MKIKNTITVIEDGPLQVVGEFRVYDTVGNLIENYGELLLCRCGKSKNKPLCDDSHNEESFKDCCKVDSKKDEPPESHAELVISCRPNGMLVARGPMLIIGADGESRTVRNKAALCRCGASRNKPFCDVSHKQAGFIDDALLQVEKGDEDDLAPAQE